MRLADFITGTVAKRRWMGLKNDALIIFSYLPSRIPQAVDEKLPPAVVMKLDVEGREVELNIFYANY